MSAVSWGQVLIFLLIAAVAFALPAFMAVPKPVLTGFTFAILRVVTVCRGWEGCRLFSARIAAGDAVDAGDAPFFQRGEENPHSARGRAGCARPRGGGGGLADISALVYSQSPTTDVSEPHSPAPARRRQPPLHRMRGAPPEGPRGGDARAHAAESARRARGHTEEGSRFASLSGILQVPAAITGRERPAPRRTPYRPGGGQCSRAAGRDAPFLP